MQKLSDLKNLITKIVSLTESSFSRLYNKGIDAFKKKDYEKAINLFQLATKEPNIKPQVYYNLALCYQYTENYDRAITVYQKFLTLNPKDYDGIYNIALVYFEKGSYPHAIEYFEKSLQISQEKHNAKALALAYLCNNEIQKAIDLAEKMLNEAPNGIDLYFDITNVIETKNSFNKDYKLINIAIDMYSKIISLEPTYFNAYLAKSICYAKKGEWENSVKFCAEAIRLNPDSYEANNQMGLVFYCCDNLDKAIKYYEKALAINPQNDFKIYSNLGYAYEKLGEKNKAIKIFAQLIKKFPDFPAKDEIKNHLRILKGY